MWCMFFVIFLIPLSKKLKVTHCLPFGNGRETHFARHKLYVTPSLSPSLRKTPGFPSLESPDGYAAAPCQAKSRF